MRGVYAKDPKQAVASVLIQYDKPDFPPSLWKTVLLNDFLELEKLYGETFALEATKPDTYSLGDKLEIEIQDSGGQAKSKTIGEFGTWTVLWDQYAIRRRSRLRIPAPTEGARCISKVDP